MALSEASEIGEDGPYDLCAAGRYWCWDAAYRRRLGDAAVIGTQLLQVAAQADRDGFSMGERYDTDHVYYVDGSPWHGVPAYHEYPCVFSWVLMHEYLGLRSEPDVDLVVAPCMDRFRDYQVEFSNVAVAVSLRPDIFAVTNLAAKVRRIRIDLKRLPLDPSLFADPSQPFVIVNLAHNGTCRLTLPPA